MQKKSVTKKILTICLVLALLVGLIFAIKSMIEASASKKAYEQARAIAGGSSVTTTTAATIAATTVNAAEETVPASEPVEEKPEVTEAAQEDKEAGDEQVTHTLQQRKSMTHSDPVVMELLSLDLDALRLTNPDVVGWICIPDTGIDYPVVQGEDNAYYLENTWNREANSAGAIFMEANNSVSMKDFNTIIYGHNMRDRSMFSNLNKYQNRDYLLTHPYAYVLTDNGVYRYNMCASYKASIHSITYAMQIKTERKRSELVNFIINYNQLQNMEIVPSTSDRLLTLSTCSGVGQRNRRVVIGVFDPEGSCLIEPMK